MSKLVLNIEEDYDFELIGISSHVKDYRLGWELNNALGISIEKRDELQLEQDGETRSYSLSGFIDEDDHQEYLLVANKGQGGFLIPEHSQLDYFLMIYGVLTPEMKSELVRNIQQIGFVLMAFSLDPRELKSKRNLLF